jgi:hypothetical protein
MLKSVCLVLFAWFITGCIPKIQTLTPLVSGVVVDAQSGKGLSGVVVAPNRSEHNGAFLIEGEQKLGIGTPTGGMWRLPTLLFEAKKEGYHPLYCQCESTNIQKGCEDVIIRLVPLKSSVLSDYKFGEGRGFSCQLFHHVY